VIGGDDDAQVTRPTIEADHLDHTIDPVAATPNDLVAQPAASGHLLSKVGQFVLLDRLGVGGMGIVYAAFDEKLERKVAIKLLATHGTDERAQHRLLAEAQAQARLSHPNVVTIYEVGTLPDGQSFIAMELVKGQTLRAWQRSGTRTWREVVAVYAAAGQGLAAAHRVGLVHRDFKPDNILLGDDGRARVTDFGLAFAAEAAPLVEENAPSVSEAPFAKGTPVPPSASRGGLSLTAVGRIAGTPGYMAPEQRTGAAVDARTDQFAFCVALYEALHGERPHAELGPPAASYPRWLWNVLVRGLTHEPSARFASMDALLAELTRRRERVRNRALLVLALVAVPATAGAAYWIGSPSPCPEPTGELTGVWDATTAQRAQAALLGTGAPFAAKVWESSQATLDQYAKRWVTAQEAACKATHVQHVQSAELLDRRTECLAGRKRSLAAATQVLETRPAQAVAHAGEILSSLGDIELCADTGVLLALAQPASAPTNPQLREKVADVRNQLARATVLLAADDVGSAEPIVVQAAELARDLDHAPVRAEIDFMDGRVTLARGRVDASVASLNKAIERAVSSHHDELAVDIYLTLAQAVGMVEQRPAEIKVWLGQAEAWLGRLGHTNDPRRVDLERARGNLQRAAGDPRAAVETMSRAILTAETLWGDADPRLSLLLRDRAVVQARLRQGKPAVADAERALALGIRAWGPDYPDVARTRRALGLLYIEQLGDVARGEHEIALALPVFRNQFGADSIDVASCEEVLIQAGQFRGDYAAALEHAERAEQILDKRLGASNPRHGSALMNLGVLRFMRKDFTGSLAAYQAAYRILSAAWGPEHATVGVLLSNIGETLLALGRAEAAEVEFKKALELFQKRLGPDHADLALPLKGLGLAQLSRGKPREALAPLERALVLRTQSKAASDPQEVAEIQWGISRALRATGHEPARCRALAEAALATYRSLGSESAERVQEISLWLSGR
jgi:tetratricopeptide (TPR) repeat protein